MLAFPQPPPSTGWEAGERRQLSMAGEHLHDSDRGLDSLGWGQAQL